MLFTSMMLCSVNVNASTTASKSGRCGNTGVVGSSNITKQKASAYTTQTGNTGSVKVDCTCKYRDVSAGKTKTMPKPATATATVNATKSFTVYEEDYMKSLTTIHSAVIGAYTWGPTNETTTNVTY